jgi:RimJ/RimL family protein N-acetyltransferase
MLKTERLVLRPFTEADVDEIYDLVYADRRVREAWSGYTGTLPEFRKRFAVDPIWHAEDGFGFLAIALRDGNRLLGLMGFQQYEPGEDTSFMVFEDPADEIGLDPAIVEVELTYALGCAYWGHGYASEAGRALIEYGFEKLGIDRIVNAVIVHPEHRSLALLRRLGFRIVKNLKQNDISQGPFAGSPGAIGILERDSF